LQKTGVVHGVISNVQLDLASGTLQCTPFRKWVVFAEREQYFAELIAAKATPTDIENAKVCESIDTFYQILESLCA
tara:strand:- start:202 stop:429 length:228 start_codon:yes stop_codon:yes gene_type:complete